MLSVFKLAISAPLPPLIKTFIKYGAKYFFHSKSLIKSSLFVVKEKPRGLKPPASDSIAKI